MKKHINYKQFVSQSQNTDGTYTDVFQDIAIFVKISAPSIKSIEAGITNIESMNLYIPTKIISKPNTQKDRIIFNGEIYRINYARKVGDEWEVNAEVLYGD